MICPPQGFRDNFEVKSDKDKPDGYAGLDENGLLKLTELKNVDFDNLASEVVDRINLAFIFSL